MQRQFYCKSKLKFEPGEKKLTLLGLLEPKMPKEMYYRMPIRMLKSIKKYFNIKKI